MKLCLILARARNGVIGRDNTMPWHLPEDLAHFKRTTMGAPVIMGRKTWDSLPQRFRPLPGRLNIVVTRQANWSCEGVRTAHSLEQACAICPPESTVWVIGGAELYRLAMPLAQEAVITEIDAEFEGDALAPEFGPHWREISRESLVSAQGLPIHFVTLKNTQKSHAA